MAKPDDDRDDDPKGDEDLLSELHDAFEYDSDNWASIRDAGNVDVRFCTVGTWDAADEALRKGRQMLKLDQLNQYLNQLENSVRQNKRGIKASPAGDGATDETATLRSNRIREIEYQSHAQEAYIQAFANCAMRSYGFGRIVPEWDDDGTQALRIKSIANPNQVVPDSDAESTSGRDWKRLFFVHSLSEREFHRDYPDAAIKDFSNYAGKPPYTRWIKHNRIQVAEYWKVIETPHPTGQGKPTREVCQYLTNGVELLGRKGKPKKNKWPGKYIPFFACYGKIIYTDGDGGDSEKVMLSYVRLARDAAKLYNWIKSTEGEVMSMVPKTPYFAYQGSLDATNLELLTKSMYEPVPIVFAKAHDEATGELLPLPRREMFDPPVQAYEIAAESARRDVQNALGRYSASDHRLGSTKVTSGVALRELDKSGDLGSYHFIDHYDDMIKFCGEQLDNLLPFYDDTPKEVAVRLPDGTSKLQRINTPSQIGPDGKPMFGPEDLRMDIGRHTITISTGPSFDSQREAGKEAAMTLIGNPQAFPIVAADAIRLMDLGPIGDQMAEDLEYLQPPVMQAAKKSKDQKVDPQQLQMENAKLKERVQKADQIMQAQAQELQGKQADAQAKIDAAKVDAAKDVYIQKMRDATSIAVAKINLLGKGVIADREAEVESIALDHEAQQNDIQRQHERDLHGAGQVQDAASQAADHAHEIIMAQQQHAQSLEQGQQAAELVPPVETAGP